MVKRNRKRKDKGPSILEEVKGNMDPRENKEGDKTKCNIIEILRCLMFAYKNKVEKLRTRWENIRLALEEKYGPSIYAQINTYKKL